MKNKLLISGTLLISFLFIIAVIVQAQDYEILDVKMREVERSEQYVTISWLVRVRNNTNVARKILIKVQFVDNAGFELKSGNELTTLQPGAITTITDTTMIPVAVYPQIKGIKASF